VILFPAIDLKAGQCVRLYKGEMDQATVFNDSPGDQARSFADAGCQWLHVVDLDGAFAGEPANRDAVASILSSVDVPVQLGGGIRTMETVEAWLTAGIRRVILGTVAVRDPQLVRDACKAFPGHVALGIDARDGKVAIEGWAETSELAAVDLARRFEDAGAAALIFTDIDRDGTNIGVNVAATVALGKAVSIPVIASGGVSGPDDLQRLVDAVRSENAHGRIAGAIAGRALYDGRLSVSEGNAILGAATASMEALVC